MELYQNLHSMIMVKNILNYNAYMTVLKISRNHN